MLYFKTSNTVTINNKSYFVYKRNDSRKFYVKHNNKYEIYSELKKKLESKKKKGGNTPNNAHSLGQYELNMANKQIDSSNINNPRLKPCVRDCEDQNNLKQFPNKFSCITNCMEKTASTNLSPSSIYSRTRYIDGLQQ